MANLNLNQFKKVKVEKDHTVLKHPDGHEIRVLHKPLSSKIQEQLHALPMAEGGKVGEDQDLKSNQLTEGFKRARFRGASIVDKQIHKYSQGDLVNNEKLQAAYQGDKESNAQKKDQKPVMMADGGKAEPSPTPLQASQIDPAKALQIQNSFRSMGAHKYDDGGPVIDPEKAQQAQDSLRKAFHFADGGQAEPMATPANQDPAHAWLDSYLASKYIPQQVSSEDKSAPVESQVDSNAVASPEVPVNQNLPPAPQGTLPQQSQQNVEEQNQAAMQMGANTQQAEANKSEVFGDLSQGNQDLQQKYEQLGNDIHSKFDETANQVAQGNVDPNHWFNSKSTGSKILTAIGMLFAGAGGGVAGKPTMANDIINKFIDNDIESQKANLNNKNTLLGKYLEMYNSLPQAENAARLTLGAAAEGLVNQAATKLGSQNAMLTAKQWALNNRQEQLKNLTGLAQGQLTLGALEDIDNPRPAIQGLDMQRWQRLKQAGLLSGEDASTATKEAQNYSEAQALKEDMEQSAKHLEKQLLHGTFSPNDRKSAINAFAGRIAKVGEGRFNLQEAELQAKALLPQPLDANSTIKNKTQRRDAFFKSLAQTPTLQRLGIVNKPQSSIRVKLNSTGQTGTIPANEFDPKLYTKEE